MKDLKDPIFDPVKEVRCSLAIGEMLREADENASVNGTMLVVDCTGVGLKHLNHATRDQNKKISKIYQVRNS